MTTRWRKSSRSQATSDCVELSHRLDAVRDTKNNAVLVVDVRALLSAVKEGRLGQ
jgi:hypothetical protein